MWPDDLYDHFSRIDKLVFEMDQFVPAENRGVTEFRADLAGMLVVTIAAMYETCVKSTMVSYAARHGREFEGFTERNFSKLSSKIGHNDLRRYARTFDHRICEKFDTILDRRRKLTVKLAGKNPIKQLDQILSWRHDFAHAGLRQTTIGEAIATHRLASVVILSYHNAFNGEV
ncbi:HEPN domain-containing protein [Leisingera daeponensis]|uniref:HEPN domain-containing protein n=1 Tax=Leisingera daeponensis TaxID=405746 RepID=UPI0024811710|nr:HEPN domain-containing protein [Leisingera daeponensis]